MEEAEATEEAGTIDHIVHLAQICTQYCCLGSKGVFTAGGTHRSMGLCYGLWPTSLKCYLCGSALSMVNIEDKVPICQ